MLQMSIANGLSFSDFSVVTIDAGRVAKRWCRKTLGLFSVYISCRLVFSECDKTGVTQVVVRCPLSEFKLSDEHGFQPQCRMPDYAASGVASVVITAFSLICFGIIRRRMRQQNRAPFAHVSKR
jgi:hypothetical protein